MCLWCAQCVAPVSMHWKFRNIIVRVCNSWEGIHVQFNVWPWSSLIKQCWNVSELCSHHLCVQHFFATLWWKKFNRPKSKRVFLLSHLSSVVHVNWNVHIFWQPIQAIDLASGCFVVWDLFEHNTLEWPWRVKLDRVNKQMNFFSRFWELRVSEWNWYKDGRLLYVCYYLWPIRRVKCVKNARFGGLYSVSMWTDTSFDLPWLLTSHDFWPVQVDHLKTKMK